MVSTMIGKNTSSAATITLGNPPKPNHTSNNGTSAIFGTTFRNTRNGYRVFCITGTVTIRKPRGTAGSAPASKPITVNAAVDRACGQMRSKLMYIRLRKSVGAGKIRSETCPKATKACQIARKPTNHSVTSAMWRSRWNPALSVASMSANRFPLFDGRWNLQVEKPSGIQAKHVALRLLTQERQLRDDAWRVEIEMRPIR